MTHFIFTKNLSLFVSVDYMIAALRIHHRWCIASVFLFPFVPIVRFEGNKNLIQYSSAGNWKHAFRVNWRRKTIDFLHLDFSIVVKTSFWYLKWYSWCTPFFPVCEIGAISQRIEAVFKVSLACVFFMKHVRLFSVVWRLFWTCHKFIARGLC